MRSLQAVAAVAPADERISWRARGDSGGGVQRGSLGIRNYERVSGGYSELGAAASTKTVWWHLRPASLLTRLMLLSPPLL